jgi:transcriptional regulator NrdR family protein
MGSREKEGSVRRRRRCTKCGYRFTTSEISVDDLKNIALMAAGIVNDIKKR